MTTLAIHQEQQSNFRPILLLIILAIALISVTYGAHAIARHGMEARVARECAERPDYIFHNPQLNRWGYVCMTTSGKWGVVILSETGKEITSFIKNKLNKLSDVIRYMQNGGYEFLH
jgi:hypothetical protein